MIYIIFIDIRLHESTLLYESLCHVDGGAEPSRKRPPSIRIRMFHQGTSGAEQKKSTGCLLTCYSSVYI